MLVEPAKRAILQGLEQEYRISFLENGCVPLDRIESALQDVLGAGAQVMIDRRKEKLD